MIKSIAVCVTSDLATDNRVLKHCEVLHHEGFKVLLIGRRLPSSLDMPELPYSVHRFKMRFTKGPFFYLFFQLRLLFYLVKHKTSVIWANDLDTVLPVYLISKMRGQDFIFDAHELFTEVPELFGKPIKRGIWKFIEKRFATKAKLFITVNNSLANCFKEAYHIEAAVIRNVPKRTPLPLKIDRDTLGISSEDLVLVLQGSGINKGRGLKESIDAIAGLDGVHLIVIGDGDALPDAKQQVINLNLSHCIHFYPRKPYREMMQYTQLADLGLAFDAHQCLNFQLALPNKVFDYFHAGIAVLTGPQPEISQLISTYECGYIMSKVDPESIRWAISFYQKNTQLLATHKINTLKAAAAEHWDNEQEKLKALIEPIKDWT